MIEGGGTQAELAAVLERQKQLKVEQKIMRQELREELMKELKQSLRDEMSSRAHDSTLQASADTFFPTPGAEVPTVPGALTTSQPRMMVKQPGMHTEPSLSCWQV